jgi:hypothetical protein
LGRAKLKTHPVWFNHIPSIQELSKLHIFLSNLFALSQWNFVFTVALNEPPSDDEAKFMMWAKSAGLRPRGVDLANFTNPIFQNFKLRGVKATQDIKVLISTHETDTTPFFIFDCLL